MKKLFYNQILDKKGTKKILSWFLENYGSTRTSQFIEELKSVGFHFATEAGLSLGFDDLKVPKKKSVLLNAAEDDVTECEKRYFQGKITAVERYQKLIDIWTTTSENLKDEVIDNFQKTDLFNPLYMMAFSGARGNISQVRQLVGMRGLMSDSAGGIIDFPIRSNFREGLTVTEYAISCYGARKGLIDTALRTADSGYLTRRLVDVAHGIMIGRLECSTKEGFDVSALKSSGKSGSEGAQLISLEKRIIGRVLAEDIGLPGHEVAGLPPASDSHREGIYLRNQEITPFLAQKIVQIQKEKVRVRSPLTCLHFGGANFREDICQLCYGWSLAHGRLVSIGEAVGILAAQSIGEPGTQLTMRTFHTGGIFSTDIDAKIFAPHDGFISFSKKVKGKKVRTFHGQTAFFIFEPLQVRISKSLISDAHETTEALSVFQFPSQSLIFVYPGQFVSKNFLCAEVSQLMSAKSSATLTPGMALPKQEAGQSQEEELEELGANKPMSKKVLSEIEGQIYFHRLAERRQGVESCVKGVGSLWVLAGKSIYTSGPLQSGDFISKNKRGSPDKAKAILHQDSRNRAVKKLEEHSLINRLRYLKLPKVNNCGISIDGSRGSRPTPTNWFERQQSQPFPKGTILCFKEGTKNRLRLSKKVSNSVKGVGQLREAETSFRSSTLLLKIYSISEDSFCKKWKPAKGHSSSSFHYLISSSSSIQQSEEAPLHLGGSIQPPELHPVNFERGEIRLPSGVGREVRGAGAGPSALLHPAMRPTKNLNLRTIDLKIFSTNSLLDSPHRLKLGNLIRVGDSIDGTEAGLTLEKTVQILRRTGSGQKTDYTFRRVHPYLISHNSPLGVRHGDIVEARQFLFELFYQQSKTGDIVQGLPKIEQLFEARRTSLHVIETVHIRLKEKFEELCKKYPFYEAARLSVRFIQRILIDEIQSVYQSQGVDIADKHIEIIIRQMTSKVIVHQKGKSPFFPDDIVDFHQIQQFELDFIKSVARPERTFQERSEALAPNEPSLANSESGIVFEPIVLGLTKVAFLTQSFISAASFQETKRVLMNSALQSRVDFLYGLKENVIVGRYIRAGTGFRTGLFPAGV